MSVGGVKMRERKSNDFNPLRVINQNKIKEVSNNYEDEGHKIIGMQKLDSETRINNRRKPARKVIRAGSLVRKNNNVNNKGRNVAPVQNEDFSNSFIEGKSFNTTNSK